MKLDLEDIVEVQGEMLMALRDYVEVLKLPNCNTCAKGLDICPNTGEPLRINCPAYWDKNKGERPYETNTEGGAEVVDAGVCEPAEGPVMPDAWYAMNKPVVDEETVANCPDDPKLLNYLKHGEKK